MREPGFQPTLQRLSAWWLLLWVALPYWAFLVIWRVVNFQMMTAGYPGIIIAPPHLRIAQHLILLPLMLLFYRWALAIGWPQPKRWRAALAHSAMAVTFALLARPILVSLVAVETGNPSLLNELVNSEFGRRFSADLWSSSASDFLLSYVAGLALVLGVRTHLDLKIETQRTMRLHAQWTHSRLQALRIRINPHFIVNTLDSAATLVSTAPDRCAQLLGRLGELLQRTLTETGDEFIPAHAEAECVRNYLKIQQLRFPGQIQFQVDLECGIENCLLPTQILQPIAEDAIVRSMSARQTDVEIRIQIARAQDDIELTVHGNIAREQTSIGVIASLTATRERLRVLFGDRQRLETEDDRDRKVLTRVRVPYINGVPRLAAA